MAQMLTNHLDPPVSLQESRQGGTPVLKNFDHQRTLPEWHDWKWQFRNRITSLDELKQYIPVTSDEEKAFQAAGKNLPFAITPFYLGQIDLQNPNDPIRKTVIPRIAEFTTTREEMVDPCGEDHDMVAPGLVHRYPDRVLFLVNETCSVYCRYCTRSRLVGSGEHSVDFQAAYDYLRKTPAVRDVLISGGDPLVMADHKLDEIIKNLKSIPHIDIVRIGTKIPVVLPQRITDDLLNVLKQYHPFYMSIHFLHPDEITPEVEAVCNRIADAGIPMFSQTVLLKGVNDDPEVMKRLMLKLLKIRVKPYYIYQCDPVQGTSHFRTSVQKGIEIMEHLRGHITGYGVPTYVIDGPGGGGKIPVAPNYVLDMDESKITLRNYKQEEYTYLSGQ
ncbi:MAG: KamA family radical SAM protein [Vampirovibrionales bacterium]|nr:KamA family radical SAM protein [Vampirovibrionales bacterium]